MQVKEVQGNKVVFGEDIQEKPKTTEELLLELQSQVAEMHTKLTKIEADTAAIKGEEKIMSLEAHVPVDQWAVQPSRPDPRDYIYTQVVANPVATVGRPRRYINQRLTIRDQGNKGSCGGQAAADAKDLREKRVTSALYAYQKTRELDAAEGVRGEGVTIRNLMKALQKNGICLEELYPYSSYVNGTPLVFPAIPKAAEEDAATRKIEAYARVQTIDEIADAIYKYVSVVAGIVVTDSFKSPENGYITMPQDYQGPNYILGGHAVDLIGYDMDMEYTYKSGRKCKGFALLANSWGPTWGTNGNAWVPFDFLTSITDLGMPFLLDAFVPIDEFPETVVEIEMDTAAFIKDDRTFTPARFIAEALGAEVNWYEDDKRVEIVKGDTRVEMWIGEKVCRVTKKGA